eukprot:TRINITY_DN38334_c0_g1_i1.p1 TRINITY_DN38334_c0_g1~~TRINITY_DN38334_c0_g1_i1.p1  ORF type:complete len:537 (+),score=185.40 TRINITY_DN38334_c0_g1_i1:135-1613(+)
MLSMQVTSVFASAVVRGAAAVRPARRQARWNHSASPAEGAEKKVAPGGLEALRSQIQTLTKEKKDLVTMIEDIKTTRVLQDSIDFVASKDITPLNLVDLVEYCRQEDYKTHLFLHRELPIRTAIAIQQLSSLPHGFVTMPSTRMVKEWLLEEFQLLTQAERPDSPEREEQFTQLLRKIHRRYQESIVTLGKGLYELKKDLLHMKVKIKDKKQEWEKVNDLIVSEFPELQEALDMYYAGRISAGFLIRQHISMAAAKKRPPRKGAENYIGLVCRKTDIYQVCKGAIEEAEAICEDQYGSHPEIILKRHAGDRVLIPHIPAHLHYILFELLKNSLRATVEAHGMDGHRYNCSETPPVEVTVCDDASLEDVSVRVSDQGGGIPRLNMEKVMSYMYTTAKVSQFEMMDDSSPAAAQTKKTPLAGFGYGLPISRLYAQHFDGDLRLLSIEGHGTDAYLHLGRSLKSTFETSLRNKRRDENRSRMFRASVDEPTYERS